MKRHITEAWKRHTNSSTLILARAEKRQAEKKKKGAGPQPTQPPTRSDGQVPPRSGWSRRPASPNPSLPGETNPIVQPIFANPSCSPQGWKGAWGVPRILRCNPWLEKAWERLDGCQAPVLAILEMKLHGEKGSQPRWADGKVQGTHPLLCSPRQQAPKHSQADGKTPFRSPHPHQHSHGCRRENLRVLPYGACFHLSFTTGYFPQLTT